MRAWTGAGCFLGCISLVLGSLTAAAEPRATQTVYSPSRTFVVSGLRSPDNLYMANWADDIAKRFSEVTDMPLPLSRESPIRIAARVEPARSRAKVVKAQGYVEGRLLQRLVVTNPMKAEQEEILEGLVWLLVNRHLVVRQSSEERKEHLAQAPDWLAVGLAQELYPQLRSRNAGHVADAWRDGKDVSLNEVLSWEYLPRGRWLQHGISNLLVAWIANAPDARSHFDEIFTRLAKVGHVPPAWFEQRLAQQLEGESLEEGWTAWVLGQSTARRTWGQVSAESMRELEERVDRTLRTYLGVPASRPAALADLMTGQQPPEDVRAAALKVSAELRKEMVGRPPEYQEVLNGYLAYLDAVLRNASELRAGELQPTEALAIVGTLERAERSFHTLARQLGARERVMDRWESEQIWARGDARRDSEATAVHAFLDRVEEQQAE